jgi:hypothetical protein
MSADIVGYTGVTASGAGYTGSTPAYTGGGSTAIIPTGYDQVIAKDEVTYRQVTEYAVTTSAPGGAAQRPAVPADAANVYAYEWDIGPTSSTVTPESAMDIMKAVPNVVFPFEVKGRNGERRIQKGSSYDLNSVRWPGDDNNPVEIINEDDTSFTFLTLPGHFRGEGHTIKFTTLDRNGRLVLRQEGISAPGFVDQLLDLGARLSWKYQADNLRAATYGGYRADFPGVWPADP